ncbi:MAG TPA: CPBP family intramembrane glutamic endopeptidase [Thermoanaerobaculia bacterium]|jgi:membrane protease YdiL (CAAX protease family)
MASVLSLIQKMHWPVAGLGLGTPANLAVLSPRHRSSLGRIALVALFIGIAAALLVLGLDQILFAGVSRERIKAVGDLPFGQRILIVLFSAVTEELIYRLGAATLVASVTFLTLRRTTRHAAQISIWLGILVACILFGLAHVGNLPNVPHPYLRAITLNGVAGLVLGWLYWFRGLEAAVLAHLAADATVYLVIASLLY